MLTISAIPAFSDNYIWALHDGAGHCAVVDPGDARPVEDFLAKNALQLSAILITHHHFDHVGGLKALAARFSVPVYGPDNPAISGITHALHDGDQLSLDAPLLGFEVLAVPGHTLDHIAYYSATESLLLCGDTLFHAGCGRLFEGSPQQMHDSLARLAALPGDTRVYCTHEYTLANMRFALAVEPDNPALRTAQADAAARREHGDITLPSRIADQRAINPFLRTDQPAVMRAARERNPEADSSVSVFSTLRAWKDQF